METKRICKVIGDLKTKEQIEALKKIIEREKQNKNKD